MGIAREISAASIRYQIATNQFPWEKNNADYTSRLRRSDGAFEFDPTDPDQSNAWIKNLVGDGDFKESSAQRVMAENLWYVIKPRSVAESVWTCFIPAAQSNIEKAAAACDEKVGRMTPARVNNLEPCDTIVGSLPLVELGERNLLCVQE
jgi:hypothetical protein